MNDSVQSACYEETDASSSSKFRLSLSQIILIGFVAVFTIRIFLQTFDKGMKVPFVGFRSAFEPSWLVRLRFSRGALPMVQEGYRKVYLKQ